MSVMKTLPDGRKVHLIEICENPQWLDRAIRWFHSKWHVPEVAYRESMLESIANPGAVPCWYLVLDEKENIVGGGGIIENDFHARKDLRPNFCALYVEEDWRRQGIARLLLDTGRQAAGRMGLHKLYLITDHEDFYEKCLWRFLTMVQCDSGDVSRMYVSDTTVLETERLILRPWGLEDAESLYTYARDPAVGPAAGWPPHTSVENSRQVIRSVLSEPETYAVVLKETMEPVGSIGLMVGSQSNLQLSQREGEIGYWIGVPYWGRGLIPEAVGAMQRYAFETLGMQTLWCAYFDGNEKSRRVMEKCGFRYDHTNRDTFWPITQEYKTEHVTRLTRQQWLERLETM